MAEEKRNWLQRLFGNLFPRRAGLAQVRIMSGYTPIFTPWGGKPWEADVVRAAVDAVARNAAKLRARHIRRQNGEIVSVGGQLERVLQVRPNPRMSAFDFQYKLVATLLLDNNAYAYPRWVGAQLDSIWPINCVMSEFMEDEAGTLFIKFYFADGGAVMLPYSDVIHLRRHYYDNDLLGSPNTAINTTLDVHHTTQQGLAQAVKTSAHLRGILQIEAMLKPEDIEKERERFVRQYMTVQNAGGIAALDSKAKYIELKNDPKMVDPEHLQELRDAVFRYFGVNENIVMGKYDEDEWNAFYESVIEPLAVQMSLEFTAKLFSPREIGHGNEIVFEANRLQYASMRSKLELVRMVDRGALTPNEWRAVMNLGPIEGGDVPIRRLDTQPTDDMAGSEGGEGDADPDAAA